MASDLIVELPTSHGYDALLVVVDRLSKRVHIIPTTSDINSVGVARLFWDYIWRHVLEPLRRLWCKVTLQSRLVLNTNNRQSSTY